MRSLDVLRKQASNPALSEVLGQVYGLVEDGAPLGEAMARYPNTFSEMGRNKMVRAGAKAASSKTLSTALPNSPSNKPTSKLERWAR